MLNKAADLADTIKRLYEHAQQEALNDPEAWDDIRREFLVAHNPRVHVYMKPTPFADLEETRTADIAAVTLAFYDEDAALSVSYWPKEEASTFSLSGEPARFDVPFLAASWLAFAAIGEPITLEAR